MNTELTTNENTAVEPSQLITLKPEKYVAEVFAPFKTSLTKAVREASKVTYDIATKEGMGKAKELRATFKKIRLDAEAARKERKAPILEIGKLLDSRYKALESEIAPHEDKYDADIKAEEQRIEEEKQRKLAIERARIEAIENRIANIRAMTSRYLQESSASIAKAIDELSAVVLDPDDYEEHLEDAIAAVNAVLVEMERMRKIAVEREAAAARAEAERAELERLRQESIKRAEEESARRAEEEARQRARDAEAKAAAEAQARRIAELEAQLAAANMKEEHTKEVPATDITTVDAKEVVSINGTYYDHSSIKENGDPVLRNADGSRSIFCDVDEGDEIVSPDSRPSDEEIINALCIEFGATREVVIGWIKDMDLTSEVMKAA